MPVSTPTIFRNIMLTWSPVLAHTKWLDGREQDDDAQAPLVGTHLEALCVEANWL